MPDSREILRSASDTLLAMRGQTLDFIEIAKPSNMAFAVQLLKIVSKLSPLVGNLIEFKTVDFLNADNPFADCGHWVRQDPGFPDALFLSDNISPNPGVEIKAWFPLATEITGRFRESQKRFVNDEISLCILAWLPDYLICGRPRIIGVCMVPCLEVARSRDAHYPNPPDYLVVEPEDTSNRASNLRQTNTIGHKWQDTETQLQEAINLVNSWNIGSYSIDPTYQDKMKELIRRFVYRIDTNYAKLDRIDNQRIEQFKKEMLDMEFCGMCIGEWRRILNDENAARQAFHEFLDIQASTRE